MLTDYFIAETDREAATAIEPDVLGSFPSVDGRGLEPVVKMGKLHALLMGRSYEDVVARSSSELIAERDEGESLVLKLDGDFLHALATSSDPDLAAVAVPWSETEEFWGHGDPQALATFLIEFAELARAAVECNRTLYCRLTV